MSLAEQKRIGKIAMLYVLDEARQESVEELGWIHCSGKVGSMESNKIVAAIETAAKKNEVINGSVYRETHALYHAIMEALHGVTRGQVQLGTVLRTVGLRFSVVRGQPYEQPEEGEWIAVALYGTIGAPVKGLEHEAIGLGINHI
ncbi:hut operon positive regulatory protein [Fictibacillus enclensis]|uniref:Hut operon positive regulatory protein n=1 Tax=Fictibacillus enclensis TaxID=1017270 RepID=A0A0V8JAJ3_9BACL|nr:hut operon transcriptional regulator HutP [Fictibacillus enclensis]KSU84166.1 transcriptional regulator [Fictibacillus enclensis]SCB74245.1 hut operon positive regulatory protein [Fictibacillus enclensis]